VARGTTQLGFERMGIRLLDENDPRYILGTFGVDEQGRLRDERGQRLLVERPDGIALLLQGQVPMIYHKSQNLWNETSQVVGLGEHAMAAIWDEQQIKGFISVDNLISHTSIDATHREILLLFAQMVGHLFSLKNTEAALRQLNSELEQRVQQRTAQLEASYREMQSFSYSISHDLRAPLRALNSFSQILQDEFADGFDPQARDYLARIRTASLHMSNLMDALLKLARISRSEIQRIPVSLSSIAAEVAASLREDQPERQVTWIFAPNLVVQADPALMRVVLQNLMGNAWKFTARHDQAHIELGSLQQDGKPVYFVRDDGAGFDMAYANKLFGPFQRLHTSTEFEGTGIGLAIVQRIIQRHGGEIWVESSIEQGATFYFTLPEVQPNPAA
jgi:signal transduction histidine kinase